MFIGSPFRRSAVASDGRARQRSGQRTRAAYGKGNRLLLSLGIVVMAPLISAENGGDPRKALGGLNWQKSQALEVLDARMPHLPARHIVRAAFFRICGRCRLCVDAGGGR